MKALTFDRFDAGIDLRKGATVTDANRMRDMLNCDVSTGFAVVKRPGLKRIGAFTQQDIGLFLFGSSLHGVNTTMTGRSDIVGVLASIVVGGYPYLVLKHQDGSNGHYWLNHGLALAGTKVMDNACPNTPMAVPLGGKVYSPSDDGASVRFSATNNPLDWSTADDAGFLPVSHHGGGRVTALAVYRGMLAVFTDTHVQIWRVDPDPALHQLVDIAHGIGTDYPLSIASVSGDVLFLGFGGVRSLSQQAQSGNLTDLDVGSPVDSLVMTMLGRNIGKSVRGHYSQSLGKFMLCIGPEVLVYSFSRTSKLAAWSRWTLPGEITGIVEMAGKTFVRIANDLLYFDADTWTDNGSPFQVVAEMGFVAMKAPGSLKRLIGMDAVTDGISQLVIAFNERDPEMVSVDIDIDGDSRPMGVIPLELQGTAFSPRFSCLHAKPFRLDLITFYYDVMGVR